MTSADPSPAELRSTPVDGVDVLGALSPSRAGDFITCPLLYRFRTIDKLPEEPSPDAVRGTVVHKVLEGLFDLPAADRTPDQARTMLPVAWQQVLEHEPLLADLFAPVIEGTSGSGLDFDSWLASCEKVLEKYFTLEDPQRIEPAERELYVETVLESKLLLRGFVDRLDVAPNGMIRVVDYKGLALDTPLPTPTGWTTMGEVQVGDTLFGSDGQPTLMTEKSDIHHRPCYRITFRDGSSVVCDNVHLWTVVTSRRQQQSRQTLDAGALYELHAQLVRDGRPHSAWVEASTALDLAEVDDLPIDPWLLGAWLGDGDSRSGTLTVGRADVSDMLTLVKEHWSRRVVLREESTAFRVCPARRCAHEEHHQGLLARNVGLTALLRHAGLLHNKHIPAGYLRAGVRQRIELLRGLMDTDGWWNSTRRRAGFTTTDEALARGVIELLRTLGINPLHVQKPSVNRVRPGRTWHVIEFTPTGFNPFALPRKALACASNVTELQSALAHRRIIKSVEPVDPVPTQCIAVDSADSLYLCGDGFLPTHNTGRSPGERYEAKALFQMRFYALVIWRTRGVVPSMLQLVYLGNGEILRYVPDEADLLATERKVEAVWQAIRLAEETGDWQPSPSRLCSWCSYQAICPVYGGTPPPLPARESRVPAPDVDPAGDVDSDEGVTGLL